ncbi:hypothetical protein SH1V18_11670 [Vallitalea longa]|uniref:Uncharacterized protein n=1 Tax=Vallitalea longa TaxID=2936439 RepID=A0A9W5Y7W5_9FIRM|nr:hypothetical protein [Vallitalea longa]GKX28687.1 hypothetical protein SH1V18_11670 [Vallitalea longa]
MKNLKKLLALMLSLAMMVTTFTLPAFAADDATEETTETTEAAVVETTNAEICEALELLQGEGHGLTEEYLAKETPRWNVALMTVRLRGLEEEAMAYDGEDTFADAEQIIWVAGRPFLGYLKTHPELGWLGRGTDNLFDPLSMMTIQEYYKVMLEVLGYAQGTDFEWAEVMDKADEVGIAVAGDAEKLTNSLIADVTVAALKAETKDGEVLAEKLVELGTIDEEVAAKYELVKLAPDAVAVDSAVALNSKVIEVGLDEAVEETNAAQFVVTDKDDEILEVESAEFAPWDADKKTVLVTLGEELKSGKLYKLTSGDDSVNFGGRNKDEAAPEVTKVDATKYNQVVITFSEPIQLSSLELDICQEYDSKKDLEVLDMEYDGNDTIVLTTEDQDQELYVVDVKTAKDFAGNNIEEPDEKPSFVGEPRPTDDMRIVQAYANEYNEIAVKFDQSLTDVDASMFKVYESNDEDEVVDVLDAYVATKDDYYGEKQISELNDSTVPEQYVILTVTELEDNTLFIVEAKDMVSECGNDIDKDYDTISFVGESKPDTDFQVVRANFVSNTEVEVIFERKVNEDLASDIANYDIYDANDDDEKLKVKEATVNGKKVTLKVESMDAVLYEVKVSDLKDIHGNDIDSDYDTVSFVGEEVADEISAIETIYRKNNNDNEIIVRFDQNIGDNATDVALYNISDDIGIPSKAVKANENTGDSSEYNREVILTIPKTTTGHVYELTVRKGIKNSDGVVSTDEITNTFTGSGSLATLPKFGGVGVIDKYTLRVFFDRDVTDKTVKGKVWKNDHIIGDVLQVSKDGNKTPDFSLGGAYAYKDPERDNALIIRLTSAQVNTSGYSFTSAYCTDNGNIYKLIGNVDYIYHDGDKNIRNFSYSDKDVANPKVKYVMALSNNVIQVTFTDAVDFNDDYSALRVFAVKGEPSNEEATNVHKLLINSATTSDNVVYRMKLSGNMQSSYYDGSKAYFYMPDTAATDMSGSVQVKDSTSNDYQSVEFGAKYKEIEKIKSSSVWANMPNNRTILVHYPEAMDETDVKAVSNYEIVKSDYSHISIGIDNAIYNSSDNTVELFLNDAISNINGVNSFYLAISQNVHNELRDNQIKNEHSTTNGINGIIFRFAQAKEKDAPDAPVIDEVKANDDRLSIEIKFDKDVKFINSITNDVLVNYGVVTSGTDLKQMVLDSLTIKAAFVNDNVVTVGNNTSPDNFNDYIKSVKVISEDTLKVTFNDDLTENTQGKVSTKNDSGKVKIEARDGAIAKTNSDAKEVPFGVAPSIYKDLNAAEKTTREAVEIFENEVKATNVTEYDALFTKYENTKTTLNNLPDTSSIKEELNNSFNTKKEAVIDLHSYSEDLKLTVAEDLSDSDNLTAAKADETLAKHVITKLGEDVVEEDSNAVTEASGYITAIDALIAADGEITIYNNAVSNAVTKTVTAFENINNTLEALKGAEEFDSLNEATKTSINGYKDAEAIIADMVNGGENLLTIKVSDDSKDVITVKFGAEEEVWNLNDEKLTVECSPKLEINKTDGKVTATDAVTENTDGLNITVKYADFNIQTTATVKVTFEGETKTVEVTPNNTEVISE